MTAVTRQRMTAEEFVAWSAERPHLRCELERGEVVEMAAEQARHALMKAAAARALEDAVSASGLDCVVFPDGMSVVIDEDHVRVPDAAVQCGGFDPLSSRLDAPVILVEVVSPESVFRDEYSKLVEYFRLPSVVHYLMLDPEKRLVVHSRRVSGDGDGGVRLETRILGSGRIELDPPGLVLNAEELLGRPW